MAKLRHGLLCAVLMSAQVQAQTLSAAPAGSLVPAHTATPDIELVPVGGQQPATSMVIPGTLASVSLPVGTPVRLMVMNEVTTRYAHIGDRFKLRVDEPVLAAGQVMIPAGALAWGEVTSLEKNGAVGRTGGLVVRLLYVDLPTGQVPLRGERGERGKENTAGVVLAVVGFGLLGLLNRGNNAKLKAGALFTGYVAGLGAAD